MKAIKQFFLSLIQRLKHYSESWWYDPFLGFLAAIDAYIFIVPIEAVMVPSVLLNRRRWVSVGLWMTFGSALGAASFAYLADRFGPRVVDHVMPGLMQTHPWEQADHFLHAHGFWGLSLISFSPVPQHAAVAVAGLTHMNTFLIFAAVLLGRGLKYIPLCWAIVYAPGALKWIGVHIHHQDDSGHSNSAKTPK